MANETAPISGLQARQTRAVYLGAASAWTLVAGAFAFLSATLPAGAQRARFEGLLLCLASLLATALLFGAAWGRRATSPRSSRAWLLLALASSLYTLAGLIGLIWGVHKDATPLAWLAGLLYFAFYPVFLAGVLTLPEGGLSGSLRRQLWFDTAITVIAAALALWLLVLAPSLAHGTTTLAKGLVTLLFPLGGLALFWALYGLLIHWRSGTARAISGVLAASIGCLILSDLGYIQEVTRQRETLRVWASLSLASSHLLLGLAAALQLVTRRSPSPSHLPLSAAPRQGVRTILFVSAALVLTLAILLERHLDPTGRVALGLVLLLVVLFFLQQALALMAETRLRSKLQQAHDELETQVAARTIELDRKLSEVTTLSLAAGIAASAEDEETLIAETTGLVRECLFPDICGVLLVDTEAKVLRSVASFHWEAGPREVPPIPLGQGITGKVALTGRARRVVDTLSDPDYMGLDSRVRSELCVPIRLGDEIIGVFNTESRKRDAFSESDLWVLNALASQMAVAIGRLRSAAAVHARDSRFRALIQNSEDMITVHEPGRPFAFQSPSLERILGYAPEELDGKNPLEFVHPDDQELAKAAMARAYKRVPHPGVSEFRFRRKDKSWAYLESFASNLSDDPAVKGIVLNSRDITARKSDENRIRRQLERLQGLHAIDSAIGATSDLKGTLQVVLEQVLAQLGVDGACVLLLDEATQSFAFAAGRGFRVESLVHQRQPVTSTFAGRAVEGRCVVQMPDLLADAAAFAHSPFFRQEMFVAYFAAPLFTKNQVVGVLEVFHRSPVHPDAEWLSFLEILAGQTAVAIENSSLFENLQRSNADLSRAYDTTLRGWSRALELRDHETQGHTERVTELTVGLGRLAGIPEPDLLHVRRGALLHDIGKMGIPDAILLKPGPLTPEEWVTMKRHVDYAHDLLAPIHFLSPALEIPCGHHERWDGSGYPSGLKGDAIPLAARVFAIVDNWDALGSDRPYRSAWPQEKVRGYLKEKAGRLFDPRLVELFLGMEI